MAQPFLVEPVVFMISCPFPRGRTAQTVGFSEADNNMAGTEGLEPTTTRLTAARSAVELHAKIWWTCLSVGGTRVLLDPTPWPVVEYLVDRQRFELWFEACKATVLPLDEQPTSRRAPNSTELAQIIP